MGEKAVWAPVEQLAEELNPHWFSSETLQGLLILLVVVGLVVCVIRGLTKLAMSGIMFLLLIQMLHIFGQSHLGMQIAPWMSSWFQYDVLQSLAQVFVGTPVAKYILYVQAFLNETFGVALDAVLIIAKIIKPWFYWLMDSFKQFGQV